jgi:AIG2-like family.
MRKLYVAYGSNMSEGQMASRCPTAKLVGQSEIKDYELLFKGSGTGAYATVEPKKGKKVPVLIWDIGSLDEFQLDAYEGFPTFYYKKNISVLINGEEEKAMVYIMDERRRLGCPSLAYYEVLEKAYRKFDFDMEILEEALNGEGK